MSYRLAKRRSVEELARGFWTASGNARHLSPHLIVTDVISPSFGRVTGYHIPREVQIGGKINF